MGEHVDLSIFAIPPLRISLHLEGAGHHEDRAPIPARVQGREREGLDGLVLLVLHVDLPHDVEGVRVVVEGTEDLDPRNVLRGDNLDGSRDPVHDDESADADAGDDG